MKSIPLILIALLVLISCDTTTPPIPPVETKPLLTLSFDKRSCTELWIKLTTKDLTLPAQLKFKQYNPAGDSVTHTFSLSTNDSLIYIDSLFPNKNYYYLVSSI